MSLSNETLHSQLKQATAELHERVECVLNLQFLASLNEVAPGSNIRNDAVAAAQRTFQFFLEELAS